MISAYLTDTVDLVRVTKDDWGYPIEAFQYNVAARVEDKIRVIRGQDGKEFTSEVHLLLDPGAAIDYKTFVMIKTRCGQAAELTAKRWPVRKLAKGHGFDNLTWEVWL